MLFGERTGDTNKAEMAVIKLNKTVDIDFFGGGPSFLRVGLIFEGGGGVTKYN